MVEHLLTAVALLLVIEGIMPFANPGALRRSLFKIVQQNDKTLRIMGLVSMLIGALTLYLVRHWP